MRVVRDLAQTHLAAPSYVTIGVFDGVHRGHQQLIAEMVKAARSTDGVAVAVTFDPHPAAALGHEPPPLLTTVEERAALLDALGLDVLVAFPFTPATARTAAADFVAVLVDHLHMVELWGGPNLSLGHRREGSISFLRCLGKERGFVVHIIEPLAWEGILVSSSRVRDALQAGDIRRATGYLGRPYRLAGIVVHGNGRGHDIGVPTANISPPPERLIPANGIYACTARTEHLGTHQAVVNVGTRPTFAGSALTVEAHLLDFDADLYDQVLALDFIARLRNEMAYATVHALVKQIHEDIAQARGILGSAAFQARRFWGTQASTRPREEARSSRQASGASSQSASG
jgi:riboflavin kinase/FMN adenylyltransferase